jgi:hypothetical protein
VAAVFAGFPDLARLAGGDVIEREAQAIVGADEELVVEDDGIAGVDGQVCLPGDFKK